MKTAQSKNTPTQKESSQSCSNTIHLVLDHSALIPCGDKSKEEKNAIRTIGDQLPHTNAIIYTSQRHLKIKPITPSHYLTNLPT